MLKNITTNNGSGFAKHQEITKKLGDVVYFTDAYASWQKGGIENTNKLIRQYIYPRGALLGIYRKKNHECTEENQFQTQEGTKIQYTHQSILSTHTIVLHLMVDSTDSTIY